MKKWNMKRYLGAIALCTVLLASACSNETTNNAGTAETAVQQEGETTAAVVEQANLTMDGLVTFDDEDYNADWSADNATSIAFSGTSAAVTGSGAEATDGGSVKITAAGTYVLSGKLSDGQLTVDVQEGTVHLVMNGVELHDNDNAPLYIVEAGKVVVTLQEGTENVLTDGAEYALADASSDEPNAALFSKADLTINGTGKLTVEGNYNNGIASKDDLKLVSGTIAVKAVDDGVMGRDLVAFLEGTSLTVDAGGDGVKSTNDAEEGKGIIAIGGGTFDIVSGNDALQAETSMLIDGGTYKLVSGGGNANGEVHTEERGGWGGGAPAAGGAQSGSGTSGAAADGNAATDGSAAANAGTAADASAADDASATAAEEESTSAKALKAGGNLQVNGGTFTIDSADDSVHTNGNALIAGGTFAITSGDDGIHADSAATISGGTIDIAKSYEGIEGSVIAVSGGEVTITASDDGVNVAGGNDSTAEGGRQGQDTFSDGTHQLQISGGSLTVNSNGDGLDSNGSIAMSGGTVIVNGPTNSGNGSVDYDGSFEISGGFLISAGSSGMAQATADTSTQQSVLMTFPQAQEAGTTVRLEDGDGNEIATFAPAKTFQSVLISSPDLKQGSTYVFYTGGTSAGSEVSGLYTEGEYSGVTKVVDFEITSAVTWVNESGVTTGGGGGMGGGPMGGGGGMGGQPGERPAGGGRPGDMGGQPPADGSMPQPPAAEGDAQTEAQ
ncbi:carbohydrate-binding domain-containing protein [Paenibacillus sp. LHD-117]|uniref:carbohydrate-binding domain-containing protein n=1 Tax=Paenibacillus sp. LHD-117 TaxID=3071412 RepID=UPI0027E0DBAD|nr:carbohydrate-binding domain-containing protein [Paenibacillus sp. LHD-117]MDQ6423433.1 carbohydrate-binding domain-containing protein [Paenibacillus sp. LHD-117]